MNLAEKLIQWLVKYFSSLNICFFSAASSSCDISIIGCFSFSLTLEGHFVQLHSIQVYKFASVLIFWFSFLITAFTFEKKKMWSGICLQWTKNTFNGEKIESSHFISLALVWLE